jgi:hypothetical protein
MTVHRIAALGATLLMASACGSVTPVAPGTSSSGFAMTCNAPTSLAGDIVVCVASAGSMNVSTAAVWTTSDPNVAASQGIGLFVGKSEGQATLTATYLGQSASEPLTVHLQDVLRVTAEAFTGDFKVGTTGTWWLQGSYGVASADFGTLTLVITDQTGATVTTSAPQKVPHGGDRYLISTIFTLPPGTTRVCSASVLQIGSTTLTAVPGVSLVPCLAVTP